MEILELRMEMVIVVAQEKIRAFVGTYNGILTFGVTLILIWMYIFLERAFRE